MTETASPLRTWLDKAWDDHPSEARRVAQALAERAPTLPDDAEGAEAVRLAEHVCLGHLADPPALERVLAALPAHAALAPMVKRSRWALDSLAGRAAEAPPDGARWRALHGVVMTLVARDQVAQARERLFAEEAAALTHPDASARQGYAATANTTAADLREGPRGDAARDALMIDAARLARRAWQGAGNWMNVERADYQLAMCHAALGQGEAALRHAKACLVLCEAEGADAAERFFAHECLVHAHRAAGDGAESARQRERMAVLLAAIEDAGMRAYCEKTLAST